MSQACLTARFPLSRRRQVVVDVDTAFNAMRSLAHLACAAPAGGARAIRWPRRPRVASRPPQARRRTLRAVTASAADGPSSTTQRILEQLEQREAYNSEGAGGAGAGMTLAALRRVDEQWHRVRTMAEGDAAGPKPQVHAIVPTRPPTASSTALLHASGARRPLHVSDRWAWVLPSRVDGCDARPRRDTSSCTQSGCDSIWSRPLRGTQNVGLRGWSVCLCFRDSRHRGPLAAAHGAHSPLEVLTGCGGGGVGLATRSLSPQRRSRTARPRTWMWWCAPVCARRKHGTNFSSTAVARPYSPHGGYEGRDSRRLAGVPTRPARRLH